jgi:hypothetical protein
MNLRWLLGAAIVFVFAGRSASPQLWSFPQPLDSCKFVLLVSGEFNARSPWDVNLVNAPVGDFALRPPDLDISKETLALLNDQVRPMLVGLLGSLGFRISNKEFDHRTWRRLAVPMENDSDRYFALNLLIDGENGLGGHYGGLDLRLKLSSFHRNPRLVYSLGFETLKPGADTDETLHNLRNTLLDLIEETVADWKHVLADEQKRPRKSFLLTLDVGGLKKKQRKFLEEQLLDCMHEQIDGFDYLKPTGRKHVYRVHYRISGSESPGDFVKRYEEAVVMSVGTHGKYPCSLWRSEMENFKPVVRADSSREEVTIRWIRMK